METQIAFKNFLNYAEKVKKYSPETIKTHDSHLYQFLKFSMSKTIDDITLEVIDEFMSYLSDNVKLNTQASYASSLRSFIHYLNRGGWQQVQHNYINIPRRKVVNVRIVTKEEVNALLNHARKPRDRLMLLLFFTTGIRIAELLNIKVEDIDVEECSIKVCRKGGIEDTIYVDPAVIDYLMLFIHMWMFDNGYVFRNDQGEKLSQAVVRLMLAELSKKAKIPHVNPHAIRHGFGTEMAMNGADILSIMEAMGHRDPAISKRYIHLSGDARKKRYNLYAPKTIETAVKAVNDLTNQRTNARLNSEFWNEP